MQRINLLPIWIFKDTIPSVYDTESGTAIEMTAKVYNAMRSLQQDYNSFANEVNTKITEFIDSSNQDQEEFKAAITKIVHDYIAMLDTKIDQQDRIIQDSIVYIKDNLTHGITDVLKELIDSGEIDEVIANAFDDLGTRVSTLEDNTTNMETRLETLENSKVKLIYNVETESLSFENVEVLTNE